MCVAFLVLCMSECGIWVLFVWYFNFRMVFVVFSVFGKHRVWGTVFLVLCMVSLFSASTVDDFQLLHSVQVVKCWHQRVASSCRLFVCLPFVLVSKHSVWFISQEGHTSFTQTLLKMEKYFCIWRGNVYRADPSKPKIFTAKQVSVTLQESQGQSFERQPEGQNTAPDGSLFWSKASSSFSRQLGFSSSRLRLQLGSMTSSSWEI